MKTSLKSSLEAVIDKWAADHCEDEDWIESYWPDNTAQLCANAVESVLDALVAQEKFVKETFGIDD